MQLGFRQSPAIDSRRVAEPVDDLRYSPALLFLRCHPSEY